MGTQLLTQWCLQPGRSQKNVKQFLFWLIVACAGLLGQQVNAAALPTNETLLTRESEHFVYIYQASLSEQIPELALHAEDAYRVLTPVLNYQPDRKVYVLFADNMDLHNGFATSFPEPIMAIFAGDSTTNSTIYEPGNYLRRTVFHELTHVLNLDAQDGIDAVLTRIFGRVQTIGDPLSAILALAAIPPGAVAPDWYVEGLATWAETEFVGPGRGRNSISEMVIRSEVAANEVTAKNRWTRDNVHWPFGTVIYQYGARVFAEAQNEATSENVPGRLGEAVANSWITFFDKRAREVTGQTFEQLVNDAIAAEQAEQQRQIDRIQTAAVTRLPRLTPPNLQVAAPVFAANDELFFSASPMADEAELYRFDEGAQRAISTGADTSGLSTATAVTPSGDIIFTKLNFAGKGLLYNHLYRYSADGQCAEYLTDEGRYRSPVIHPSGNMMAAIRVIAGRYELVMVPINGAGHDTEHDVEVVPENTRLLLAAGNNLTKLIDPVFSPSGDALYVVKTVAAGVTSNNSQARSTILRFALDGVDANGVGQPTNVLSQPGLLLSPTIHPNGRSMVFSSDATGVFNLYRVGLSRTVGTPQAITNVIGGVFAPLFSADGTRLAAVGYDADGYYLTQLSGADVAATRITPPTVVAEWPSDVLRRSDRLTALRYGPVPSLTAERHYWSIAETGFDYWTPWLAVGGDDVQGGVAANFSDPTGIQNLFLLAGAESEYGTPIAAAVYTYDGFFPTITAFATTGRNSYNDLVTTTGEFRFDYDEEVTSAGLAVTVPIGTVDWGAALVTGYRFTERDVIEDAEDDYEAFATNQGEFFEGDESSVFAAILYSDADVYRKSNSLERGRFVNVGYEWTADDLGGELNQRRFRADWNEYIPMPWVDHHVLKLQGSYANGTGDVTAQGQFGIGGFGSVLSGLSTGVSRNLLLRGYETNSIVGDEAVTVGVAYRAPIWQINRGTDATTPIYFKQLFIEGFAEAGKVNGNNNDNLDDEDWLTSYGAELNLSLRALRVVEFAPGLGLVYAPERDEVDNDRDDDDERLQLYISLKASVSF